MPESEIRPDLRLDWNGDFGDEVRSILEEYGLTEEDAESDPVTAATIADRIRTFPELAGFTELMQSQCQIILNTRLRLEDHFTSQICDSNSEMLQIILTSALYNRCPLLDSEGYTCIASKQPVIYISASFAFESSLNRACSYLLFSSSRSIRVIPNAHSKGKENDTFPVSFLDCDAFAAALEEDKQAGRMPLCAFGAIPTTVYRGNALIYRNDNLAKIRQICDTHGVWLHVSGADLTFLSASDRPDALSVAVDAADSFAIRSSDIIHTGSDTHILLIRSAQFNEKLRKPPVFEVVTPVYNLLSSLAFKLQSYTETHLQAIRLLMQSCRENYSECFQISVSQHSEMRPTFHIVPKCVDLDELGLSLQTANGFLLEDMGITNLNSAVVYDSHFDGLQLTIRPFKFDELGEILFSEGNVQEFLQIIEKRIKRLAQGLKVRSILSDRIAEKKPFTWSDKSNFSCHVGIGAFRLVPAFLTAEQHEAANGLNDCLAAQLFERSSCFRGCFSDDNLVNIAILTIPKDCPEDISDDEIADYIFDIIFTTQAGIQYPQAVIELLSESLQMGIEKAETYLMEMQNRNFSPFEIIRSVPIIGHVLGWLFVPAVDPDAAKASASVGQSFDLESKSLSRRATLPDASLKIK